MALVVQIALGAALIVVAVNGFPVIGGGPPPRDDARVAAAALPAVPRARVDRFDERRAFALVRQQVAVGERPAGSPALRALARRLRARLPRGRFEPVPGHPGLRNVVGVLPGRRPAIVVAAHYDTLELPGFVGANDGAGGTAAVVELARALQAQPRPPRAREVRFVLFDGEEQPAGSQDFLRDGVRGAKAYVRAHRREVRALVLLDFVANKGLRLPREASSDTGLWARLRAAAARVGVGAVFTARTGAEIEDDHTPFLAAGIPAVDLIDWPYRYWHTRRDTIDKLSPRSLDAAGEAVLELLRGLRAG